MFCISSSTPETATSGAGIYRRALSGLSRGLGCALMLSTLPLGVEAEGALVAPPQFDRIGVLGIGAGPQYLGSEDAVWAVAPAARLRYDRAVVELQANYLTVDLLPNSDWNLGPAGILRFGRGDVDDDAVAALPDIDMSIDLGLFASYDIKGDDLRDRWSIGVGVLQDATGAHGGYVVSGNIRRWVPVGRYGAFGVGVATSWASDDYMDTYFSVDADGAAASGLPEYSASAGWRDARVTMIFVQPVSESVAVGAGLMYSYLLQDASDSSVVRRREQVYGGIGIARIW